MKRIDFIKRPLGYFDNAEFVAFLPHIDGEDELHKKIGEALKFPSYYGNNWNALYDCLRDFNWMDKKGIVLVHNEIPKLTDEQLRIYIEILIDSVNDWKEDEEHYFKVIFPKEAEDIITSINRVGGK